MAKIYTNENFPLHFGMVICTENLNWAVLAAKIDEAIKSTERLDNQLIRVIRGNQ